MKPIVLCTSLVAVALYAAAGCDERTTVTPYKQSKDTSSATAPAAAPARLPGDAVSAADSGKLTWKLPEGWREDPNPRPMREATLLIGDPAKAEVVITRLSGGFGDFSANVNRWRAQVGLDALQDTSSVKPTPIPTPLGEARSLKIEGPEKSSIVAMLQRGDATWFFRMTGEKATVNDNEGKLAQLLSSLSAGQ